MSNTWFQQSLTPPTVYEFNLRVGVIPSEDHVQVLAEIKDPTTGILLGQWSRPHTTTGKGYAAVVDVVNKALAWFDDEVDPF